MRRVTLVLAGLSLLTLNACDNTVGGNTQTNADGGSAAPQCEASEKSGIWMQAFGPLTQEISTGGQAKVAVVMVHRAASQNEMKPAAARKVSFKIIIHVSAEGNVFIQQHIYFIFKVGAYFIHSAII